jgi:hypothetical protein
MRLPVLLAALAAIPSVALASGPVQTACEEHRDSANVDCACAQAKADEHMSAEDQVLAADFIAQRADPMQLMQMRGQQGAMAFLADFQAWGEASNAACGTPPPGR